MFDDRSVCAHSFQQLADQFADGFNAALLEDAGDLLIKAHRCGFIAIPGLAELVERAESRRQDEDAEAAAKAGLPTPGAQLFEDFAGFNRWPVELSLDAPEHSSAALGELPPDPASDRRSDPKLTAACTRLMAHIDCSDVEGGWLTESASAVATDIIEEATCPPPPVTGEACESQICALAHGANIWVEEWIASNEQDCGQTLAEESVKMKITGDAVRGVANSQFFSGPKTDHTLLGGMGAIARHYALVLKLLSDKVKGTDPTDARNCWVYEQAMVGRPWKWIARNIPDWCPDGEQITSVMGAKGAAARYAKGHGLPPVPKRKPGRPKN